MKLLYRFLVFIFIALSLWACGGGPSGPLPKIVPLDYGPPSVDIKRLVNSPQISGVMVSGTAGDWLLQNERMVVIVSNVANPHGFAKSGGNIIDAAPIGAPDLISEVFTYFDDSWPRQAIYKKSRTEVPDEATRVLIVSGHDSEDTSLLVETSYSIEAGTNRIKIETQLVNTGSMDYKNFELGDAIEWGRTQPFLPGAGRQLSGQRRRGPWLAADGAGTAYLFLGEDELTGPHGDEWSDPIYDSVTIAPGDTVAYTRWLVVSPGSVADAAHHVLPDSLASVYIQVIAGGDLPIEGAEVTAIDRTGKSILVARSRPDGWVILDLLPGRYRFDVSHARRGSKSIQKNVSADDDNLYEVKLPDPARVYLAVASGGSRIPARWSFTGIDGTPTPNLGPDWNLAGAGNYVFTPAGPDTFEVPAGKYRITCSRGPRYEVWQSEVSLSRGRTKSVQANLVPVLFSRDWVAVDLHSHGLPSPDSRLDKQARVQSMVCEGVDIFAITDHGYRSDYQRVIDDLGVPVQAWVGEEVTTDHLGHFNVFPAPVSPDQWGQGAVNPLNKTINQIFDEVRSRNPNSLIQVNHPRSGREGYLDSFSFDPYTGEGEAGFRDDFDLLEILNGKPIDDFETIWKDWKALLAQGKKVVGVGNSDSHRLVDEDAGYPRNFIYAPDGDVLGALKAGRCFVTCGPLIDFTLAGARLGDRIQTEEAMLFGRLKISAAAGVSLRQITILVNGKIESVFKVGATTRQVRFDEEIEVMVPAGPSFVQILVEGPERPLAFTNPVWIFRPFPPN